MPLDFNRDTIEREIRPFRGEQQRFESCITHSYRVDDEEQQTRKNFFPYIGNGKFGLPLDVDSPLYIRGKRALDQQLPFYPTVQVDTFGASKQSTKRLV